MTISELGEIGDLIGSVAVFASLIYLALEVRQNTSQQKREETVSIHHGQNSVLAHMLDPNIVRAYALASDGDVAASVSDRATAIIWVIQYLNHFQIVCDLYDAGSLETERFDLWKSFAVGIVASKGIMSWWEDEQGKLTCAPRLRGLIERHLRDTENPPIPFNQTWEIFKSESWHESPSIT